PRPAPRRPAGLPGDRGPAHLDPQARAAAHEGRAQQGLPAPQLPLRHAARGGDRVPARAHEADQDEQRVLRDDGAGVTDAGRLLAVDWGEKRIGVARSDESQTLAQPLTTLTRRAGKRFPMRQLVALLETHAVTGVVVGLPLDERGDEGAPARSARQLAAAIPSGATLDAAVDSLASSGVIGHPGPFRLYAKLRGLGGSLKSGVYLLRQDESWADVVAAVERGRGVEQRFIVREGLRLAEVAELAQQELGIPHDSFVAAAQDAALLAGLGLPAGT